MAEMFQGGVHRATGIRRAVVIGNGFAGAENQSIGKPVYVIGGEHCTWKFADFQNSLRERGAVRPFTGIEDMSQRWRYTLLNDTAEAARRVNRALAERGWSIQLT